jgi:dihydrofolate reductase
MSCLPNFKAIAAMSLNRVIGAGNKIPWHLPEDFKWFKQVTSGHVIVMGRKTFESIGKPLPGRTTIVLSRAGRSIPGVRVISDFREIEFSRQAGDIFICGGAQVYQEALPLCSDLYLTLVKQEFHGDAFFPKFEHLFHPVHEIFDCPQLRITHYRNRTLG